MTRFAQWAAVLASPAVLARAQVFPAVFRVALAAASRSLRLGVARPLPVAGDVSAESVTAVPLDWYF
jgi:hypothetical protein